ncbi:MAG: Ca-activated chloride channel family protein [Crocinitomix sp.]|jgi:Ca-activated chloride channel family protein
MKRTYFLTKFNLILALLLFTVTGFSQTSSISLKGIVKDDLGAVVVDAQVTIKDEKTNVNRSTKTNTKGYYEFKDIPTGSYYFKVDKTNHKKYRKSAVLLTLGQTKTINPELISEMPEVEVINEVEVMEEAQETRDLAPMHFGISSKSNRSFKSGIGSGYYHTEPVYHNTESYNSIEENGYKLTGVNPLSTFSVDVDAASYSNVRRFLLNGQKPDKGAVRVEELINYFHYDYPNPTNGDPFSITTEIGDCPWNNNKLVHIGLQGERIEKGNLPASNLVFLLDVSGSMDQPNKLPLLKKSFKMLVNELGDRDRIAIVVYAGAAGVVLNSTTADNSTEILAALEKLNAGGSTAGGAGIKLAYQVATENFIQGGNNRVILATDGDFNIGMSSDAAMKDLIEEKRKTGVFLTCLGFGTGNIQDSKMETLADKGNGNYAYIDNLLEAKKVLVTEIGATLVTIAKDVKIQVEFNPTLVESYRLIGYENRLLNDEDFNDDKKDAGEIGAGHSVTALYEVMMKGEGDSTTPTVDPFRYQEDNPTESRKYGSELLTVKFRYKAPDGDQSKLLERNLKNNVTDWSKLSDNYKFSAAVAGFGMLLRESEFKGTLNFDAVLKLAKEGKGSDNNGYRAEFLRLVDAAKTIYQ